MVKIGHAWLCILCMSMHAANRMAGSQASGRFGFANDQIAKEQIAATHRLFLNTCTLYLFRAARQVFQIK
jgi:hypothetical protein